MVASPPSRRGPRRTARPSVAGQVGGVGDEVARRRPLERAADAVGQLEDRARERPAVPSRRRDGVQLVGAGPLFSPRCRPGERSRATSASPSRPDRPAGRPRLGRPGRPGPEPSALCSSPSTTSRVAPDAVGEPLGVGRPRGREQRVARRRRGEQGRRRAVGERRVERDGAVPRRHRVDHVGEPASVRRPTRTSGRRCSEAQIDLPGAVAVEIGGVELDAFVDLRVGEVGDPRGECAGRAARGAAASRSRLLRSRRGGERPRGRACVRTWGNSGGTSR